MPHKACPLLGCFADSDPGAFVYGSHVRVVVSREMGLAPYDLQTNARLFTPMERLTLFSQVVERHPYALFYYWFYYWGRTEPTVSVPASYNKNTP